MTRRMTVRNLLIASILCAAVGIVVFAGQTPAPQTPAPNADPYANNAAPGTTQFPLAAPAGQGQQRADGRAAGRGEPGAVRSGDLEVRSGVQSAAGLEDLESGQAEDDAGRQGDRRHAVQRHRSGHLLRDGQRRLRLHLDRDAARLARLGSGGPHVAHLPERQGGARRARRLHRRAGDPARARRRRAGGRGADGRHGRTRRSRRATGPTSRRSAGAATAAARRSTRRCGAACPAAIATRSTTTSC